MRHACLFLLIAVPLLTASGQHAKILGATSAHKQGGASTEQSISESPPSRWIPPGDRKVTDDAGNVYTISVVEESLTYRPEPGADEQTIVAEAGSVLFKFGPTGAPVWTRTWGNDPGSPWGFCPPLNVVADSACDVYVAGYFDGSADFGPDDENKLAVGSRGWYDAYLCKFSSAGDLLWARTWGGPQWDDCTRIALDSLGNVYALGSFGGRVDFDPGPGTETRESPSRWGDSVNHAYLSKFNSDGEFLWVRNWGGNEWTSMVTPMECAADSSGNVFAVGSFENSVDFDPDASGQLRTSKGMGDAFLIAFGPDGVFKWVRTFGAEGEDGAAAIELDSAGHVYLAGNFEHSVEFLASFSASGIALASGDSDIFLLKLDYDGRARSVHTWGGASRDLVHEMGIDPEGNLCVVGSYRNAVDFDVGGGIEAKYDWVDFLSVFRPNGTFLEGYTWE